MYMTDMDSYGNFIPTEQRASVSTTEEDASYRTAAESNPDYGRRPSHVTDSDSNSPTSLQQHQTELSVPGAAMAGGGGRGGGEGMYIVQSQNRASLPRQRPRGPAPDAECHDDLMQFLRNRTPPGTNYMSVPTDASSLSSAPRQEKKKKSRGCAGFRIFRRGSNKKKKAQPKEKDMPAAATAGAPRRKHRPPQIQLPDTAIAGTTINGYRHIAISIPIEHAHLGPESPYQYPGPNKRKTRSLPPAQQNPRPNGYEPTRQMNAFVPEGTRIGTQLVPVIEERESLSSRSIERLTTEPLTTGRPGTARTSKSVSRNTFGTNRGDFSLPNSRPGTPRRSSVDEFPRDLQTEQAVASSSRPNSGRPVSGNSAYSFRSFASSSHSEPRVCHPARQSSVSAGGYPADWRPPSPASTTEPQQVRHSAGGYPLPSFNHGQYSRDSSSRDYTATTTTFDSVLSLPSFAETAATDPDPIGPSGTSKQEAQASNRYSMVSVVSTGAVGSHGFKESDPKRSSSATVLFNPVSDLQVHVHRDEGGINGSSKQKKAVEFADSEDFEEFPAYEYEGSGESEVMGGLACPSKRRDRRRSSLSRSSRVAELRRELEKPDSSPKDLVKGHRRQWSDSSQESVGEKRLVVDKRQSLQVPSSTTARSRERPKTSPGRFSLSSIMTVAEVRPESPPSSLTQASKESLSVSSPATIVKTSPYNSHARFTPPASPLPTPAATPETTRKPRPHYMDGSSRQHTPLKRVNSFRRKRSVSFREQYQDDAGLRRARASGKGVISHNRSFSSILSVPFEETGPEDVLARSTSIKRATPSPITTSILKMSRSELFDRYEALREKQTRDMEKRLARLEKNGDYWLTSMLPILTDLTQTLGRLATDDSRRRATVTGGSNDKMLNYKNQATSPPPPQRNSCEDGRKSLTGMRWGDMPVVSSRENLALGRRVDLYKTDELDRGEVVRLHGRRRAGTLDEITPKTLLPSSEQDDARSSSLSAATTRKQKWRSPVFSSLKGIIITGSSSSLAGVAPAVASSCRSTGEGSLLVQAARAEAEAQIKAAETAEADRLRRVERINEKIDARMRSLSIGTDAGGAAAPARKSKKRASAAPAPGNFAGPRSAKNKTLYTRYESDSGSEAERESSGSVSGLETIEPLMRELQLSGPRMSLEGPGRRGSWGMAFRGAGFG